MQVLTSTIRTPNVHLAERWISAGIGTALAVHALRHGTKGIPEFLAGALMIHRGITGKCEVYRALGMRSSRWDAALPYELGIRADSSITIAQPRASVYTFLRDFENLPRFVTHLISVEPRGEKRTRWVAQGPLGKKFGWDAELINEVPNELIAWKSLPGADIDSAGSVLFSDIPDGSGTHVRVELQYNPPAGIAGAYFAKWFGREPEQEVDANLRRLKQFLETGEIPSGQDRKRMSRSERWQPDHVIEEAFT